jgi:FAD-dependent oxidoreductase domain-containing protein 1
MQQRLAAERRDVVIVGGGVMGAALSYWLRQQDPTVGVTVIERDPTYAQASSALSAASIRQQYTTPINIAISQQSLALLRSAADWLAVDGQGPDLGFVEGGYLYLGDAAASDGLRSAHRLQRAHGADVVLLPPAQLAARYPWLRVDDIALGSLGLSGEGWFDGYGLLMALHAKARSLGVERLRGEVTALERHGTRLTSVCLRDGRRLSAQAVVNAAGPWARQVARMAGVVLPVSARRRTVFVLSCPTALPRFPLLIDTTGFWIRPEGSRYIGGCVPLDDAEDLPLEPDTAAFESTFWPALAHRVPAFAALRVERAWAGYYDMNTFDHNGIVGVHPEVENFYCLTGFSGHGMQQAPAVGRALAERMLTGAYHSLDLAPLSIDRIGAGRPLWEGAVIG